MVGLEEWNNNIVSKYVCSEGQRVEVVQVLEECGEDWTRGYNITGGRMCVLDGDLRATQPCVPASMRPCAALRFRASCISHQRIAKE